MRCLFAILGLSLAAAVKVRYDGYKVLEIIPVNQQQVELLSSLQQRDEYDFWLSPRAPNKEVIVMVPPEQIQQLEKFLRTNKIRSRVKTENVQHSIDADELKRVESDVDMNWTSFQNLKTIYKWLNSLPNYYEEVKTVVGGVTYERRKIRGIDVKNGDNFTGVVIESGIHGRDWLAPAATSWVVNEILKSPANSIFRQFNYLYFPVFNPDSYVYTWKTDRLWKRTRKPYNISCYTYYGADPNRNFDFQWKNTSSPGFNDYQGPNALSEVEVSSMTKFLKAMAKKRNNDIYLSFRAIGRALLHPWGWTNRLPKLHKLWQKVSLSAAKAWNKVNGSYIQFGTYSSEEGHQIYGNSLDWYYKTFNCTFPFMYKMRGDDFIVPPELIVTAGREHLASLQQLLIEYKKIKPKVDAGEV